MPNVANARGDITLFWAEDELLLMAIGGIPAVPCLETDNKDMAKQWFGLSRFLRTKP